ncbi:MAG: barstar family protein [Firmicutes bacterium]|nr:barstar family protein [Bacillota bacterium]
MNRIVIDGSVIDSKETFFHALRSQLGEDKLPGSNLDALHDVLTSITVHTVIEVRNQAKLAEALGDYWKRIFWLLNDCLDENRDLKLELTE